MKSASKSNKWCIVPLCKNTSKNAPDKVFVHVPKNAKRRQAWIKAIRRDEQYGKISDKSVCFVCEDHFNLEEDMKNYRFHKTMGGYMVMKENAVPHIFDCQNRKPASSSKSRMGIIKINRKRLVKEAMCSTNVQNIEPVEIAEPQLISAEYVKQEPIPLMEPEMTDNIVEEPCLMENGAQTKPVHHRSIGEMCTPHKLGCMKTRQTQTLNVCVCNVSVSPVKNRTVKLNVDDVYSCSSSSDEYESGCDSNRNSESEGQQSIDSDFTDEDEFDRSFRVASLERVRALVKRAPQRYIGVMPGSMRIVDLINNNIDYKGQWLTPSDVVLLVLMKVRLNDSFPRIGDNFGISAYYCSKLFSKYVSVIAGNLKQLIVSPPSETIFRDLPVAFQARSSDVQSIIDCLEIEIERPSDSAHQVLTWSEYEKCNTIKYLVSVTPDGLINFLSRGFGGRVSDVTLLQDSGFLERLQPGMTVMVGRGFKNIENCLLDRGCRLLMPPSVSENSTLNQVLSKETERIEHLRIHLELLIRRIRGYRMLTPHACLESNSIGNIDYCVQIAAGLINVQGPLI